MKNVVKTKSDFRVSMELKHNIEKLSFLSHISHGIRTPLNSIMGFSKLLVMKDMASARQKEYIQGILNGSSLLLQFVQNIMDLSQFEADNYSTRVLNYDVNQILWDFTEDFYNNKDENYDTNINLMLVWESKVKDLVIETDSDLVKKALQRIINLLGVKFPNMDIEMGYRLTGSTSISIYLRPSKVNLNNNRMLSEEQLLTIDENESFDFFNYKVLLNAVSMLDGELSANYENQEFILELPMTHMQPNSLI